MRILVVSWPGYGHLLPMVPLIRAAQQGGHEVRVSSGADMSALIGRLGVPAHRSGVTLAESYARMPDRSVIGALPAAEQPGFAARHLFGAGAVDRARDVLDLVESWRPDLVVHDTLELGSPVAAVLHGIPHVTHGYGPMVPDTSYFAGAIGAAIAAAGLPDPTPAVFAAPYLDICPPGLRGTEPYPWPVTHPLRPTAGELDPYAPVEIDFAELPHRDTVYVTLGTITNQAPAVFRAVLDGCARHPVNLVMTTGPDFDPAQLGPLPPAVRTAPFLPQAAVLPHCRAVVSHAGAGTMLGALCHGLPQLCLPQGTDQPFNTAALLPTGAGLALQPPEITADAVGRALGRLLDEPSFRQAADSLRAEIEQLPAAADVLAELLTQPGTSGGNGG
jgi:UDP:flavonoid glycosyltransferase YjiC (YdhE family)